MALLQQSHQFLPVDELFDISNQFTAAGDKWRDAAVQTSGIFKGRLGAQADYDDMGDRLIEISQLEEKSLQTVKTMIEIEIVKKIPMVKSGIYYNL